MMSWHQNPWRINVVGRVFVEGVYTPSVSLVTRASVRFAILTEITKQLKRWLKK
jgi:hypothetical protein